MGEFHRLQHPIDDHGRSQAGAQAEEEHTSLLVAAERLHGRIVDDLQRLAAEGLAVIELRPSRREVMRIFERTPLNNRARIADGDSVVGPVGDRGFHFDDHLAWCEGRARGDL